MIGFSKQKSISKLEYSTMRKSSGKNFKFRINVSLSDQMFNSKI